MSPKVDPFAARAARKAGQGAVPGQPSGLPDLPSSVTKPSDSSVVTFAQGRADKAMTLTDLPDPVETPEASGDLSEEEEFILGLCMKGIRQFENAWWVMAKALANVNARRLYRKTHTSFESFAKDTLNKSRPTAYEEITAYAVGELMSLGLWQPLSRNCARPWISSPKYTRLSLRRRSAVPRKRMRRQPRSS